jgi:predicted XRE-type DNA-binding protein
MREQELTAIAVGKKVGIAPADISRIRNADLGRFSIDRLVRILNGLEQKVEVSVSPAGMKGAKPHDIAGVV